MASDAEIVATIHGTACANGILGSRLMLGAAPNGVSYNWDALNRLTPYQNGAGTATTYAYRADGMRVSKSKQGITRYRYDGQMGIEDVDNSGNVKQYGVGARGIDYMDNPAANGGWTAFPLYDAHGNMVATLTRGANGTYTVGNVRSFDAGVWFASAQDQGTRRGATAPVWATSKTTSQG